LRLSKNQLAAPALAALGLCLASDTGQALLSEASQKISAHDCAGAEAILTRLLEDHPKIPEAYNLKGVCEVESGALAMAAASFRHAIELKPAYPAAQLNLAGALQKQGKQAETEEVLRSAIRLKPDFTEARIDLAKLLLADKKDDDALEQFEAVIAREPDQVFALGNAGLIFARRSDYPKAVERLSKAHTLDPNSTPLALALAEAQIRAGRQDDAERVISDLRATGRLTGDAARVLASVWLQLGQPVKGAALVKQEPRLAAAYRETVMRRAQEDFINSRYQAVAAELEAVRDIMAPDFTFHKLLGTAYYELGDARKASDELQAAIRLDPKNEQVYFDLGMLYLKFHTPELASLVFEHGLNELPDSPLLWMGMGLTQHLADQTDKAATALKKAIALDPGFTDAYVVLGDVLESDNKLEEAMPVFQDAIQKQPNLYIGHFYYGRILVKMNDGRMEQAIGELRKAVELRPEFAEGHYQLGLALEHTGRTAEAIAEYEASVRRDPALAEGQYRLALLYRKQGDVSRADVAMAAFKKAQAAQQNGTAEKKLEYRIANH
jgi:tetratricopeptide (TPR) repeat protein